MGRCYPNFGLSARVGHELVLPSGPVYNRGMDNAFWDFIRLLLYLAVYPLALIVPVLAFIFRRETGTRRELRNVFSLLTASALVLFSFSLQLFFSHIDIIQEFSRITGEIFYLVLSQLFWAGLLLYILKLRSFLYTRFKWGKTFVESLLKLTALISTGGVVLLLPLLLIPVLVPLSALLAPLIFLSAISLGALYCQTLFIVVRQYRNDRSESFFALLTGGDFVFALILMFLPGFFQDLFFPLFFLFHFACLLSLVNSLRKAGEYRTVPGDDDKFRMLKEKGLSPREAEIALALSRGQSYQDAADTFHISLSTVQTHVGRIYRKLDIKNKAALAHFVSETTF